MTQATTAATWKKFPGFPLFLRKHLTRARAACASSGEKNVAKYPEVILK